ncbi:hypothetical protein [Actinoplanes sp. URMC 104]|uniref:hypothetical protein n=1 Tax=Actinoplanes sp. URMC 104 TaxID=3423409 RepID=UPI003F52953E
MTQEEAWESGRGMWKVNKDRIGRQRFALVVGEGVVRAIAEIIGLTEHDTPAGTRIAVKGRLVAADHPLREAYLAQPDPVTTGSHNPVGYRDLPEERPLVLRPCACGCGGESDREFLPGHDVRAVQRRVRERFGGSALALIQFIDALPHIPLS